MFSRITVYFSLAVFSIAVTARAEEPIAWVSDNLQGLVELYEQFHSHPELSFQEQDTSARLAAELEATGAEVSSGVGGYGVVGLLENGQGPTLMLRTDMDALPITEQTGLAYASRVTARNASGDEVGVMHACGHDVHMSNLVGVARYLSRHRGRWSGTVMLVGQPAEERGAGARAMLADGLFQRFPKPDYALALHVDPTLATGRVGYRSGYAMANVDSIDLVVHGKGGHGAYPHTTIDPVVQTAQLALSLQTIVSREIKPIEPAVITIGSLHCGTKHNIISDKCELQLTVRSYSSKVRQQLLEGIRRKALAAAASAAAPEPTVKITEGTSSLWNNEQLVTRLAPVFERTLGKENVEIAEPSMAGEDFSRYGEAGVPILMYRLGAVAPQRLEHYTERGQNPPSLHSPLFYPDIEETLITGVGTMASAAVELLSP